MHGPLGLGFQREFLKPEFSIPANEPMTPAGSPGVHGIDERIGRWTPKGMVMGTFSARMVTHRKSAD